MSVPPVIMAAESEKYRLRCIAYTRHAKLLRVMGTITWIY